MIHNVTASTARLLAKRFTVTLCAIGLTAWVNLPASGLEQPINPPCAPLAGTFHFTALSFGADGTTARGEGVVVDGGDVIATFVADYEFDPRGEGVVLATASHEITFLDGSGSIITSDEIRLQGSRANSRLYIVGGTDAFEGATGLLHTHGTIEEGIDFKGQVCVPE